MSLAITDHDPEPRHVRESDIRMDALMATPWFEVLKALSEKPSP